MENFGNTCTVSKNFDRYKFIAFVSCSSEDKAESNNILVASQSTLSGKEASDFYKEVISSPPSCNSSQFCSNRSKEKLREQKTFKSSLSFNKRHTIFHYAQYGNLEGIEYCLSKNSNIDEQDMYGWTALMCAAFEGHLAAVEYLIKCGANVNLNNKQGQSALDIAMKNGNSAIIHLLKNGIKEEMITKDENVVKEANYCSLCTSSFSESTVAHKRSIAHLLCCKKDDLSTIYYIPESNKGFQIMLKKGWDKNKGLGTNAEGRKFPVKTILKSDRSCIGGKKEVPRVTHFGPKNSKSVETHKYDPLKIIHEHTLKKWKKQKLDIKERQKEICFRREFYDM